jgi:hypothetical protein
VNIAEARRQCELFIAEMADNRPNCDDAGVARKILSEVERYGQPTARTRARLTHWCHTNGTLYQRGVLSRKQFATQFTVESCPVKIDSTVMSELMPTSRY